MSSRVTIGRLRTRFLVGSGQGSTSSISSRLGDVAQRLQGSLGTALAGLDGRNPDAVWLIRKVEVELGLDTGGDADLLARHWAITIARGITRQLDAGADGVVSFPSRAAYLARFLDEVATGEPWNAWYFAPFDGLRMLPASAALRTAILAQPGIGLAALLALSPHAQARVVEALGKLEARRLLLELAANGDADVLPPPSALLAALSATPLSRLCADRLALGIFLRLAEMGSGRPGDAAAAAVRALAALAEAILHERAGLLEAFTGGRAAPLYRAAGADFAERLIPLLGLPHEARIALVAAAGAGPASATEGELYTSFGGLFLLLRDLGEVPLPGVEDWPAAPDMAAADLVRFLVLASCAGPERAFAVLQDQVWRALFGLPPRLGPAELARWADGLPRAILRASRAMLQSVPARGRITGRCWPFLPVELDRLLRHAAAAVLHRFAHRLPGFSLSSPPYLWRNFLDVKARVTLTPELVTAELSRPPLEVILGLTGMMRAGLDLPWLAGRPIRLQPET
jgi:hypothetical protein